MIGTQDNAAGPVRISAYPPVLPHGPALFMPPAARLKRRLIFPAEDSMKKLFSLSFQHKVFLAFLLLMNLPFLLTGYMASSLTQTMILEEKKSKLIALAHILDTRLDPGGYDALLKKNGVENASREEKIAVLNRELITVTDEVGESSPGLGVGYYSRELDAIITYGPKEFHDNVGVSIPADHPGRLVMGDNMVLVRSGTMVRGDIMNAMIPIARHDKVIGYIWANELTSDVTAQIGAMTRNIIVVMVLCFGVTFCLLLLLSRRTVRDVDSIISGLRLMRADITRRIPSSGGELGEVANSINAMADGIEQANKETSRAISVLKSVMSNVQATVYVCDPATKTVIYANEHLCALLGRENIEGEQCYAAIHGFTSPCSFCPQKLLFEENGEPQAAPVQWEMHNTLMQRDFIATDRLVTWHDGRLLHMEVGTDITERKALALAEAANQAQRDFLARMSHEIRTPMNGVLGMTRLAMQADPPPAQMEYLKKIQSSASLLLGIINDILDFSRIEAGKLAIEKHPFNLHDMVENIKELILPRVQEHGLRLNADVDPSVPTFAVGDELRLSQVLLNLLGNASKFTLEGSISLRMTAAHQEDGGAFRLVCEVSDTGIGMSMEQQDALFSPFTQADASTSRKFGGTGLGLSISKALVELMGGEISLSSEPGCGSTFTFFIPLDPFTGNPEDLEESDGLADVRYDGHTFLLVEDNSINQEIALAILTEIGARVDVANNGEEGVAAFLQRDYSLILMDVRMPVMDGLEATRAIRSSGKHDAQTVPIIAMTANAMLEDRQVSREAGMNGHVAKPIDLAELTTVLQQKLKSGAKQ